MFQFLLGFGLLVCVSCGGGKKYYPVRGSVLVNGKPAEGVTVLFNPVESSEPSPEHPTAGTKADGSFELGTYVTKDRILKAGAPAGTYVVTCIWLPPDAGSMGAGSSVPDKLNWKFVDPKKSKLRVEIPEHAMDLAPFELEVGKK